MTPCTSLQVVSARELLNGDPMVEDYEEGPSCERARESDSVWIDKVRDDSK